MRWSMPNVLASETSPYLRQHASNPVDWMPWGPAAIERARGEDKPLLVSIGYSSCHWCHVMERESFEDERTAAVMNESFVCVKVDREERPDIDALYMEAVQSMTGHGGWPLNVFLTPELDPFYGGTYFPPAERHGMPSWTGVLQAIAEAWERSREDIRRTGARLREHLGASARMSPSSEPITQAALDGAVARLSQTVDAVNGGFGGAPKFPPASVIDFLLLRSERTITLTTLRAMARGGIHDQLGGGFARYSVDASWTVPHFEKMLYDNALLVRAYLHGWQASGDRYLLDVCLEALGWATREMRGPEGGFYSALDADSEGAEGRYYVWTAQEIADALANEADTRAALAWFGVTPEGNFRDPHDPRPGRSVLQARGPRPDEQTVRRIRARLLEKRAQRARPGLDDKRLTAWNALMIIAYAETATALAAHTPAGVEPGSAEALLEIAVACAEFILGDLRDADGRLLRVYNDGEAKIAAYLEDHAFLLEAMIALFEAGCEERWLEHARELADEMVARFADPELGGFFSTAAGDDELIVRRKELEDTPIPSGSSSAALGLLRLSQLTGDGAYERHAVSVLRLEHEIAVRHPAAFGALLQALHHYLAPARPIACLLPSATRSSSS